MLENATIGLHSLLALMNPVMWSRATGWLDRPLRRPATLALAVCLSALPAWLMRDALGTFFLKGDDFAYLADSRNLRRLLDTLFVPHNAHIVPLFRIWTYLLAALAGRLERLQAVLAVASYVPLALTIIAAGVFVARETRSQALGLVAVLFAGTTSVMQPATSWYAAGQALWSGLGIVLMLLALQAWRANGGSWRLALAALAVVVSVAFWSGGYASGPVGFAYLWASGSKQSRRAAAVPLLVTLGAGAIVLVVAGKPLLGETAASAEPPGLLSRPIIGLAHTCQAIPEVLILNNLGLDARTTPAQGVVLTLALVLLWAWLGKRTACRLTPLEAAGSALVACGFLLVFTFRSYLPYSSLRALGWYHAIPQVGAVLFGIGWYARHGAQEARSTSAKPCTRGSAVLVIVLAAVLLLMQWARAERLFASEAGAPGRAEALSLARQRAHDQRLFLARLDEAEQVARREGIGRRAIAQVFGRIIGPGLPREVETLDAADLLDLPAESRVNDPAVVRRSLGGLLEPLSLNPPRPVEQTGRAPPP